MTRSTLPNRLTSEAMGQSGRALPPSTCACQSVGSDEDEAMVRHSLAVPRALAARQMEHRLQGVFTKKR